MVYNIVSNLVLDAMEKLIGKKYIYIIKLCVYTALY